MERCPGRALHRPRRDAGRFRRRPQRLNERATVVLVRHGESLWNAEKRIQGHGGAGLSDLGREQAKRTAEFLHLRYPDAARMVRSDLQRVVETAAPWEESFAGDIVVDERLRELDVGSWSGLTWDEVEQRQPGARAAWRSGEDFRRGGGETFAELRERVWGVVQDLASGASPVIVFTHGGPIRVAVAAALELPPLGERRLVAVANCSVTELRFEARGVRLAAYNAADHL